MPKIRMTVTLSQTNKHGHVLDASTHQTIVNPRDERDILHATGRKIQEFAREMEGKAQAFKDKYGKRPVYAFRATQPIAIRVHFDDELVMDTERYTSSAVMNYRLTLKKIATDAGFTILLDSFDLTKTFATPVVFKRKK